MEDSNSIIEDSNPYLPSFCYAGFRTVLIIKEFSCFAIYISVVNSEVLFKVHVAEFHFSTPAQMEAFKNAYKFIWKTYSEI